MNLNHLQINECFGAELLKTLIYSKNDKGPKTEPSGTPHVIGSCSDITLSINTYCFLLER